MKKKKSLSRLKKWYYDAYEKCENIRYTINILELPEYLSIEPHPFIIGERILYDIETGDSIVIGSIDEDYNLYYEMYLK